MTFSDNKNTLSYNIARELLNIQAIEINFREPISWSSGGFSPFYVDNRKIISNPSFRNNIKSHLSLLMQEKFKKTNLVAGVATAGIPYAILLADYYDLPCIYVRNSEKDHGLKKRIEGHFNEGQYALVVEDLVTTGRSTIETCEILIKNNINVIGACSVFSYNFYTVNQKFFKKDIPFYSLTNFEVLLELGREENYFDYKTYLELKKWKHNLKI